MRRQFYKDPWSSGYDASFTSKLKREEVPSSNLGGSIRFIFLSKEY